MPSRGGSHAGFKGWQLAMPSTFTSQHDIGPIALSRKIMSPQMLVELAFQLSVVSCQLSCHRRCVELAFQLSAGLAQVTPQRPPPSENPSMLGPELSSALSGQWRALVEEGALVDYFLVTS